MAIEEVGVLRVSLGLDSANFTSSLSEVNRKLRAIDSEFKAVGGSVKGFENTLEGLQAKSDMLTKKIDLQKTRIQELKRRYEESAASKGKEAAETEKLLIAYNRAVGDLKKFENELQQTSSKLDKLSQDVNKNVTVWDKMHLKFDEVGQRMRDLGGRMQSAGQGIATTFGTVSTAIGGALGFAVKKSMDFEAQIDRVGAIAGATPAELNKLKQSALDLGASTSKSATEVAQAQEIMAAMGYKTNEIIAALPGVISAAEASGEDMALVADTVSAALNSFGLKASEASRVADILAQSANDSAAGIEDMQYTFKYAAPIAKSLGISLEELAAATEIMSNAGIKGEQAGTTLRGGLIQLLKPSEETSKMMEKLGIEVEDSKGNFVGLANLIKNISKSLDGQTRSQKLANLASMVGTEAASGFLTLMEAGPDKINKYTKSLQNSAGASQEAAKKMKDNLKGALENLSGAFETAQISVGNALAPAIRKVAEILQGLIDRFNKLSPSTQRFIAIGAAVMAIFAGIATAIGVALAVIGGAVSGIGALITAFSKVSGVISATGRVFALLTNPVGIAVAAIALIGVALVTAYKHSKTFRDFVNGIPGAIKGVWQSVSNFFTSTLPNWGNNILNTTKNAFNAIITFLKNWGPLALAAITGPIGLTVYAVVKHWDSIKSTTSSVFNSIKSFLSNSWNGIKSIVGNAVTGIKNGAINGWNAIKSATTSIFNAVKTFLVNLWNGIKTSISNTATGIKNGVVNVWNSLKSNTVSLFNSIKSFLSSLWNGIKSNSVNAVENIKNGVVNGWNTLKSKTTSLFSSIKSTIANTFNDIVSGAKNLPGKIANGIRNGASTVVGAVKTLSNKTVQSAGNLVNGVINGVNWVLDKVGVDKKLKKWPIPQYAKGTGGHPGGPMIVGDGGQEELVILPNGETYISPNTSTLVTAPAGTQVLNGEQTKQLMNFGVPFYAEGTLSGIWDKIKSFGSTIKDKALEVWDYIDNPKKLLDKVLDKLGISVPSGGGGIGDVLRGSLTFIKDKVTGFLKKQLDFGGGNPPGTGVQRWRPYVIRALAMNGLSTSESMVQKVLRQIQTESGGNPLAVQHGYTDINTIRGDLAKGLMQTISATFNAYKFPGHDNIFNGFDNLLAALNYAKHRYGKNLNGLGEGHGYAEGAFGIDVPQLAWLAEGGWPESVISLDPKLKSRSASIWYKTGQALGLISPAGLDDKGTDGLMTTFNGLSNTLSKLNQAIENQNSNNPIQVILHYNGTGSEQDAYKMVDIIENELGNRTNARLRMSGVRT
ncbi:phage tail tape measure protein [Bacillus smithii]|uniref:phage tail tape measure protein n=1 Tax=Bacillus smithii TaxID=1479 RepID=UPI0030CA039D